MNPEPMSVKMETTFVIRIASCNHRLTLEKVRLLHSLLGRYILGNEQSDGADKARTIQACVVEHFGLHQGTFMSAARDETYSWPRHLAIFLTREMLPELSTTIVGNLFQRERSTISYAEKEVRDRMAAYPQAKQDVDAIRAKLNGQNGGAH